MAYRTVYTSTITLPVYASWKCEKCDEVNFSKGAITCSRQASSSSLRNSKQEAASNRASTLVHEAWTSDALKIILAPRENPQEVRAHLSVQNSTCCQCGAKARWDKDMKYMTLVSLGLFPAIISGIFAMAARTNITAWAIFSVFLGMTIIGIYSEMSYKKMMKSFPLKYTPVIGSLNSELLAYAHSMHKKVPTPDEAIEIAKADGILAPKHTTVVKVEMDNIEEKPQTNETTVKIGFCRKCGTPLLPNSDFCHKCGAEVLQ